MLTPKQIDQFNREGYFVARQVFTPDEIAEYRAHYMMLRQAQDYPGDFTGVPIKKAVKDPTVVKPVDEQPDPLQKYPRMIHMHRWDDLSLKWLLDQRLCEMLSDLLGTEPYAVQTMLYFKPPGARGQALHQDQFYLRVQPGTCMAAWLALDDCDEINGCMQVVPGSQDWSVLCTVPADTTQSFTDVTVALPEGQRPAPVIMKAGDVLFFGGSLVHGSFPNQTNDRFRRSLIGHYIVGEAEKVGEFYHPVLRMDGSVVDLGKSEHSTTCGIWVDREGKPIIEIVPKAVGTKLPEHE